MTARNGEVSGMRERAKGFGDCGKGYRVSACYGMLADVALLARKARGLGLVWGTFGMLTLPTATNEHNQPPHRPTYCPKGAARWHLAVMRQW